MRSAILNLTIAASVMIAGLASAAPADITGRWELTTVMNGETNVSRLEITFKDGRYAASVGPYRFEGAGQSDAFHLTCVKPPGNEVDCGELSGAFKGGVLQGGGRLSGMNVTWFAKRPTSRPKDAIKVHDFEPTEFHRLFSGAIPPVLHIFPGDTIRTKTVDSGGVDEKGVPRSLGGNPQTGPFYVEGAMPGDTIAVHFNKIRLNRDNAESGDLVVASAFSPYYLRNVKPIEGWDSIWSLDRQQGTAKLAKPTSKLKNFVVAMKPMLGCVGVAPPAHQSFRTGDLGPFGGNMDYNQIQEGVTLYLPVFQAGALLFVGDGHALQGDGELTGDALETSMSVEFTVDLIEGRSLGQPRAENDEYVMVMGIGRPLEDALQSATTGMARWLKETYQLNDGEVAMVLGSSMHYDIAEIVDPKVHVVAKIRKDVLGKITP